MDPVTLTVNGVVSLVTAAALTAVILSPRVHEGALTKFGLIVVTLSLYASGLVSLFGDSPSPGLVHAAFVLRVGLLIVCAGAGWRIYQGGVWISHGSKRSRRQ